MKFTVGEKVSFLNQKGNAVILNILSSKEVWIRDEDGFEMKYPVNELVKIHSEIVLNEIITYSKDNINQKNTPTYSIIHSKNKQKDYWELDLHIEQIMKDYKSLTAHEILLVQIKKMKDFLRLAKMKGIKKVIIIHGVGEGVLKNEIRIYLHKNNDKYQYFDASYLDYGKGATEVLLY
ncbi:MAG: Smr/MutS family protein [Flavobacteriia bacterium]|nr:Smr/MutS family protein [Flavobacteriia bacterium]